jgi:hypothetical protein
MAALKGAAEIESPQSWAYDRLDHFIDQNGKIVSFDELYRKRERFCIALARFSQSCGLGLPYSVLYTPEMDETPDFGDVLEVMSDYAFNYLKNPAHSVPEENLWFEKLTNSFREMGFELENGGCKTLPGNIREILGNSQGKISALLPILEAEGAFMGDELRALVLCDPESDPEGCGALEVFSFISLMKDAASLKPVLISGKNLLVHESAIEDFLIVASVFLEHEKSSVTLKTRAGKSEAWLEVYAESQNWNTRISVPLVTSIFERGLCRCLVSTRSLLGEGWNAVSLNTLVDLTAITSYAYVNQIRGRSIRLDEKRPFKIADNWDIVTVMDDPDHGSQDLERLRKKYTRFFGISIDGIIERGIGHAHPLLSRRDITKIYRERISFNNEMLSRAGDRLGWYKKWKIGKPYSNRSASCLEIELPQTENQPLPLFQSADIYYKLFLDKLKKLASYGKVKIFYVFAVVFSFFLGFAVLGTENQNFLNILFFAGLCSVFRFIIAPFYYSPGRIPNRIKKSFEKDGEIKNMIRLAAGIIINMIEPGENFEKNKLSIAKREDGSLRVCYDSASGEAFSRAFAELCAPAGNQKYLLAIDCFNKFEREFFKTFFGKNKRPLLYMKKPKEGKNYFFKQLSDSASNAETHELLALPVPEMFSKTQKDAALFCALWKDKGVAVTLAGRRSAERAEIMASLTRAKALPFHAGIRELWD